MTDDGVLAVELTRVLVWEFGIPMAQSVSMVEAALAAREDGEARFIAPSAVSLHFPLDRIQERVRIQMLAAMEAVPNVSRGRPRRDR